MVWRRAMGIGGLTGQDVSVLSVTRATIGVGLLATSVVIELEPEARGEVVQVSGGEAVRALSSRSSAMGEPIDGCGTRCLPPRAPTVSW